jgi:hypothetical protein
MNWVRTVFVLIIFCGSFYYGYALGDRDQPYHRLFGVAEAVDPTECGLPPGPTPEVIHIGDCVRTEWTIERHRVCDVSPRRPIVERRVTDRSGTTVALPIIRSQQVNGIAPRMSKTFVQPEVAIGNVSYGANVCLACPTNAFLLKGRTNPIHLIWPLCIDENSIEYEVKAH